MLYKNVMTEMSLLSRNATQTILVRVLGVGLVFLIQVTLARTLGVDEYGIYSYVISWISIISLVGTLGFDTSLARFVPSYIYLKKWSLLHGIIRLSFGLTFAYSLLAVLVVAIVVLLGSNRAAAGNIALLYALPLMILVVLTSIRIALLRSMKRYMGAILPETVLKPLVLLCLLGGYYLYGPELSSKTVIIIHTIAASVSFLVASIYLKKIVSSTANYEKPVYKMKLWISVSFPVLLISSSIYIISQADIIMLGLLVGYGDSGVYTSASKLAEFTVFFMTAVNFVIAPMISDSFHKGDLDELTNVVLRGTRISFSFSVFSSLFFLIFGGRLLSFFGEEFVLGYEVMLMLIFGHLVNAASGPVGLLLTLTGNQMSAVKIVLFGMVANIVLNYLLIPKFGLVGAALSTMLATIFWNIAMLMKVRDVIGINPSVFGGKHCEAG